jgi:hypothetical protein
MKGMRLKHRRPLNSTYRRSRVSSALEGCHWIDFEPILESGTTKIQNQDVFLNMYSKKISLLYGPPREVPIARRKSLDIFVEAIPKCQGIMEGERIHTIQRNHGHHFRQPHHISRSQNTLHL